MEAALLPQWPGQQQLNQQIDSSEQLQQQEGLAAAGAEDAQAIIGQWGIGVSQENRPEGLSYKVRVCLQSKARYLGRCVRYEGAGVSNLAYSALCSAPKPF
jgi:hypothetical protein